MTNKKPVPFAVKLILLIIALVGALAIIIEKREYQYKGAFLPWGLESATIRLCDITEFEWDTVEVYRRPMDTAYQTPQYSDIYRFDSNFHLNDNMSLLVFYLGKDVTGYIQYPSYGSNKSVFVTENGGIIAYLSLNKTAANFQVIMQDEGYCWTLLKE